MPHPAPALPRHPGASFVRQLLGHDPDATAVVRADGVLTYAELARRVDGVAQALRGGPAPRRLVAVEGANTVDALVAYLGALAAGDVVLLTGEGPGAGRLLDEYDPDVVIRRSEPGATRWIVQERRPGTAHVLHPDLALLLSTSGSSGSPKVVRLSHENLRANAQSIVAALGIQASDRAATSLPMHYCYGLSVIHSHLLAGASLLVTDRSVVDRCFWDLFREHGATTFAGVPYTFECLDRIGFSDLALPSLRYVTQAGGRMPAERIATYAELGRDRGWELVPMYGQTEATARIAVLPGALASTRPASIGFPVPGGSLRLDPVDGLPEGTGELVYRGPNVMLGYATGPAELRLGRTVDELRTGDIGRETGDGSFEIVGRRSSFLKIAGLRIDLDHVESLLREAGLTAACAGSDRELVVAVEGPRDARAPAGEAVRSARRALSGLPLPSSAVRVVPVESIPRLTTGKPDRVAVGRLAEPVAVKAGTPAVTQTAIAALAAEDGVTEAVRRLYSELLEREVSDDDTFVGLGGDSLSYVQVSLGLEEILGPLPERWSSLTVRELAAQAKPRNHRRARPMSLLRWQSVETGVVLRALAIVLIVATHTGLISFLGGAHVLIAVAGYNFARFQLTAAPRLDRVRSQVRAVARLALPASAWIAVAYVVTGDYGLQNVFLLNGILGPAQWSAMWHYWFIEVLVYILAAMAVLMAVPAVDRAERRWPFGLAAAVLVVGLLSRFAIVDVGVLHTRPVLWLFAIGWAASRSTHLWQRLALLGIVAISVPGYYSNDQRVLAIMAGLALLIMAPRLRLPSAVVPLAGVLASASLYIYLVHWQVYLPIRETSEAVALVASLVAGVIAWAISRRAGRLLGRLARRARQGGAQPRSTTAWWRPGARVPTG